MITVVDYGAGNLGSVEKAFRYIGEDVKISGDPEDIIKAKALVLPGVGAYGDVMEQLKGKELDKAIIDYVKSEKPFLGICLGLQLLFDFSEEGGKVDGLGIFKGAIRLFPESINMKIPQIGWNSIRAKEDSRLFKGLDIEPYVYFVHSYYLKAENRDLAAASCNYGIDFDAAIEWRNTFAVQFHPEKSGETGLKILRNFSEAAKFCL